MKNYDCSPVRGRPSYKAALNKVPGSRPNGVVRSRPVSLDRERREEEEEEDYESSLEGEDLHHQTDEYYHDKLPDNHLMPQMRHQKEDWDLFALCKENFIYILIAMTIAFYIFRWSETPEPPRNPCPEYFNELKEKFPNQDKYLWPGVYLGINGVLKDESRPSIITFLYNDTESMKVFNAIVDLTKMCISPSREPIVLTREELNGETVQRNHGVLIEKYKSQLLESQIMLVKDLQKISAVSSRAFHDFCDTHSPIVERYVVYFTLLYTEEDLKASETANDLASNLLKRLWDEEITSDVAAALIARVTELSLFLNAP